ncbi:hypothetical protein N7468_005060 [Penicillium chermesinum]|uniref:Uncharacterized protein n=1 Tax=Penicillium chermesinum TaxID=63820 RepID=A0A9W9TPB5_9EURO|nr:uncharacterized protein N7468_005060 [Penicillium chermesinum]KAJ5232104.1 hypothetical protein N7468_005060 [Penicillium chermesinum]
MSTLKRHLIEGEYQDPPSSRTISDAGERAPDSSVVIIFSPHCCESVAVDERALFSGLCPLRYHRLPKISLVELMTAVVRKDEYSG